MASTVTDTIQHVRSVWARPRLRSVAFPRVGSTNRSERRLLKNSSGSPANGTFWTFASCEFPKVQHHLQDGVFCAGGCCAWCVFGPAPSEEQPPVRLVIGISGSTGAIYGVRLLEVLQNTPDVETH